MTQITGMIKDAQGNPVAGVTVTFANYEKVTPEPGGGELFTNESTATITDAHGSFTIDLNSVNLSKISVAEANAEIRAEAAAPLAGTQAKDAIHDASTTGDAAAIQLAKAADANAIQERGGRRNP